MINKLLKLIYAILAVGLLFVQYASAMPTDNDPTPVFRSEYLFLSPLVPQLSSDGKTLHDGILPVVYVADPNPSPEPLRIQAPFNLLTAPESATATFSITYVPNGDTDTFGQPCITFPDAAKAAFDAAANIWRNIIQSSVPITIRACWANLSSSSILGYSGGGPLRRDFTGAPRANTWYGGSLANALAGSDLDPSSFDMHITYNLNFSWYDGTDGNTPAGQHDLMSVVLHEIAHGLNFSGSMSYSGGTGNWGCTGYPNIYDTFMRDGTGNQLINTGFYGNPSTALGTALTSNDIWFHGSNAMAANGGQRVKIYAPSPWSEGSSYSHLDYSTFHGTANRLMVYAISSGDSIHDPGPVTIGILKDLGWGPSTSSCTYSIDPVNSPIFSLLGGTGSFNITTQAGCAWTATESLDWVAITSGGSGTGSSTVTYTVSSNTGEQRSGAITISGQAFTGTHTTTQAGPATNLLQNPGFESGNTVWIQESGSYDIISQSTSQNPIPVHNGSWAAWFGGYENANDVLYQQITIPSSAFQAYVQFWYYIETDETSGQNDFMTVEVRRNSDNALLKTLKTFSNLDSTSGWVQSQQFYVTEFKGQTIRLRFAATLNVTNNTNFFIDDVTLMVTSGANAYVSHGSLCGGESPCFASIQNGIDGAANFTIINITQDTYIENVILDDPKVLSLQGGWDSTFTTNLSNTAIQGSLTISDGTLIVENIILQ